MRVQRIRCDCHYEIFFLHVDPLRKRTGTPWCSRSYLGAMTVGSNKAHGSTRQPGKDQGAKSDGILGALHLGKCHRLISFFADHGTQRHREDQSRVSRVCRWRLIAKGWVRGISVLAPSGDSTGWEAGFRVRSVIRWTIVARLWNILPGFVFHNRFLACEDSRRCSVRHRYAHPFCSRFVERGAATALQAPFRRVGLLSNWCEGFRRNCRRPYLKLLAGVGSHTAGTKRPSHRESQQGIVFVT